MKNLFLLSALSMLLVSCGGTYNKKSQGMDASDAVSKHVSNHVGDVSKNAADHSNAVTDIVNSNNIGK